MNEKGVAYTVIAGYAVSTAAILVMVALLLGGMRSYTEGVDSKLDLIDQRLQRVTVRLTETREHQRQMKDEVKPVLEKLDYNLEEPAGDE